MSSTDRKLHLNLLLWGSGTFSGGWRTLANPRGFLDIDYFQHIARVAEQGTFDALLVADVAALEVDAPWEPFQALEPTVLLSAIAAQTTHIGLIGTGSAIYNDPFTIARRFAALDHISHGRAALNVVTGFYPQAAANYSWDKHPERDERYARAEEFVDVLRKVWDSWEDEAVLADVASDRFTDADKIHLVDHAGDHFSVRGPSLVPRSPQGHPVLVQAGSSDTGRNLGARIGEIIFTPGSTIDEARAFYNDMKSRAASFGRGPDEILILPGFSPIIGSTEAEARARKAALNEVFAFGPALERLAGFLAVPSDLLELDKELPYDKLPDPATIPTINSALFHSVVSQARKDNLTVRRLLLETNSHMEVIGGPEQIADVLQEWFEAGVADGFNLLADVLPVGLELFVEHVIPELRKRGIFRDEYEGTTLRENLGLRRPANQFAPVGV